MEKKKPIVSWYRGNNPTNNYNWIEQLTEINVIRTKILDDKFINICLENKDKLFLHIVISGMGNTPFEPKIPTVKETFNKIKKLIDGGFSQKQILVVIDPIIPNDNGLNALKLLLKLFTEFSFLRLRFIRFNVLQYREIDITKSYHKNMVYEHVISNKNITDRKDELFPLKPYLIKIDTFKQNYYKLIKDYESIISIDNGYEALIGVRELLPFGYNNSFTDSNGETTKIIEYERNNKFRPILNIIGNKRPVRCSSRCKLCPFHQ